MNGRAGLVELEACADALRRPSAEWLSLGGGVAPQLAIRHPELAETATRFPR